MAINPSTRYPGQVDTSDPTGYPYGKGKNITVPGDGTGTPWERDVISDIWGFFQAALDAAGITPSGTPDKVNASQVLDAIVALYAAYTDESIENVSLQAAYLRSVALGETTPHIALANAALAIGGTAGAGLLTVNGLTGRVGVSSGLDVEGGIAVADGTVNVGGGAATIDQAGRGTFEDLQVNTNAAIDGVLSAAAATVSGALTVAMANVAFSGGGGGLASGPWAPAIASVSGTGPVSGDFTSMAGHYVRLGNTVMFTIYFVVDTTGWSGPCTVEFDPPVGTTSGNARGTVTLESPSDATDSFALLRFGTGLRIAMTPGAGAGVGQGIHASGSITVS